MPRISFFYGIAIYMYWRDHGPPHFHAQYGEHWAALTIADGQILNGSLPPRALRMVREWRRAHEAELAEGLAARPRTPSAHADRPAALASGVMVLRVTDVEALDGYRLRITFNDGAVRDVDFAEDLARAAGTLAEPLRDLDYFRQVRVDEQLRTIVWPNGLDADPDVLHGDRSPVSLAGAQSAA